MDYNEMMKQLFPMASCLGWDKAMDKKQMQKFAAGMEGFWNQGKEMQKEARKAWKEQWNYAFTQFIELEQAIASILPDPKAAALPGMPVPAVSPKEMVEKAKAFQEKANAKTVEQLDHILDTQMKQQEKMKGAVTAIAGKIAENLQKVKPSKKDEKSAEAAEKAEEAAEAQPDAASEVKADGAAEVKATVKSSPKTQRPKRPASRSAAAKKAEAAPKAEESAAPEASGNEAGE